MSTRALTKTTNGFSGLPAFTEDLFRPLNDWFSLGNSNLLGRSLQVPAVNITEDKDAYQLSLGVPGMKKTDFNIDVEGNLLTVSCEKEETRENNGSRYTRKEYGYSSFSRSFSLPDEVMKDQVEATYEDGVLKLILPKKEEAKKNALSKHITVK